MALDTLREQTIIIYPNCDAGGKKFIELIERYLEKDYIFTLKNLSHVEYLSLMKSVDLMIGNSSSGIIEAPSFKLPVINIGNRQQGRERSENIIDIQPIKEEILDKINFVFNNKDFLNKIRRCKNKFGDGKAAQKMVKIFKDIKIDDRFIQKQITY
jgi:UDP-N-acetylglucosamine 2-epimerase (non-hydrolysing)/GDP/UDP-N,N'-diacetylbacillosamine 2-epimerase (hydrolysing)